MWKKTLAIVTILIALALAVVASIWHDVAWDYLFSIGRFFDAMLPVLAVGALIKYIFCCHCSCDCGCHKKDK